MSEENPYYKKVEPIIEMEEHNNAELENILSRNRELEEAKSSDSYEINFNELDSIDEI